MLSHPITLIVLGALIQAATVVAMRQYGISFWALLPANVLMLWLLMRAYASPVMDFITIWFIASGVLAIAALVCGVVFFGERISTQQVVGIALVAVGVVTLRG